MVSYRMTVSVPATLPRSCTTSPSDTSSARQLCQVRPWRSREIRSRRNGGGMTRRRLGTLGSVSPSNVVRRRPSSGVMATRSSACTVAACVASQACCSDPSDMNDSMGGALSVFPSR